MKIVAERAGNCRRNSRASFVISAPIARRSVARAPNAWLQSPPVRAHAELHNLLVITSVAERKASWGKSSGRMGP